MACPAIALIGRGCVPCVPSSRAVDPRLDGRPVVTGKKRGTVISGAGWLKERQTAPPPQKGMPRVAPRAFDDGDALAAELAGDRIRLEQNLTSYLQQVFSC